MKFFLIALLGFQARTVLAQETTQETAVSSQSYTVVPQLSLLQSSLKGSDISGSQTGYDIGANVTMPVSANVMVESGLLYSKMGAKNDALFISDEYDLRYLRVPVGVTYQFGESSWYTRGGAYLAFLTSSERKSQFLGLEAKEDIESNKLDYGVYVGGGYSHDFGSNFKLNVELNYGRGFAKVFKSADAMNESIGLTFGVPWSL